MAKSKKIEIEFNHDANTVGDILTKEVMADEESDETLKAQLAIVVATKVMETKTALAGLTVLVLTELGNFEEVSVSRLAETLYSIDSGKLGMIGQLFMMEDLVAKH